MITPEATRHPFEQALSDALADIRTAGIAVQVNNLGTGVGEDVSSDELADPSAPRLWHAGRQDYPFEWVNGLPYYRGEYDRIVARALARSHRERRAPGKGMALYFDHGGAGLLAAVTSVEAFRSHGLCAAWGGTSRHSIRVLTFRPEPVLSR